MRFDDGMRALRKKGIQVWPSTALKLGLKIVNLPPARYKGPNTLGPCSCAKKTGSFAEKNKHHDYNDPEKR